MNGAPRSSIDDAEQAVERVEDRERQQHRHAAAGRIDALLLVERHHFLVHLLALGIGELVFRVAILDRLHLRLQRLHLPHRHHAAMAQREDDEVDEHREHDDRPAVVADVAVDPLERLQQRHDEPGEHAEVDRAARARSRRPCSTSKSFGPMKNGRLAAPGRRTLYGDEVARAALRIVRHRQRHRLEVDLHRSACRGSATLRKYCSSTPV